MGSGDAAGSSGQLGPGWSWLSARPTPQCLSSQLAVAPIPQGTVPSFGDERECRGADASLTNVPDRGLHNSCPASQRLRSFLVGHDRQGRSTLRSLRQESSQRSAASRSGPRLSPQAPASGREPRACLRFRPWGLHRGRRAGSLLLEWVIPPDRRRPVVREYESRSWLEAAER